MTDPADDIGTTRSEERLRTAARRVPIGRAVLRKTVVVERRTLTVEVRHEEVELVVLPFDGTRPEEDEETHRRHPPLPDLVLHEEQIVVTRTIVPIERVRLRVDRVTTQQRVVEDLRHEEITLDDGSVGE